jgi:hypothetical protein
MQNNGDWLVNLNSERELPAYGARPKGAQCHLLFCAEGAKGAIAWGEALRSSAQPQD